MEHADRPEPLIERLKDGFDRIAFVLRSDLWSASSRVGLNPTQAQVLALLVDRPAGLRAKDISAHLSISAASVSDTLSALIKKNHIKKLADPGDARASIVKVTPGGLKAGRALARSSSHVERAIAKLAPTMQEDLLLTQISLIRQLQHDGAIPQQRMCPTCRYFRPQAHAGQGQPHHCAFVDAPIGNRTLRLDCGEHEQAEPADQAATWSVFTTGSATLQAGQKG
ncbi:MarR family winged helix-turn-helix transcriptional regulator [Brucella tritici]|uniref:Winged helix-turn-helix transcriptional regulator n=1 Tax=Brucella tritici TaxID=94626 RepID=A0A6L3YMT6_9HYPH|nr:winged helix-turn-helix transcriptional regulator [Brucella tritici]